MRLLREIAWVPDWNPTQELGYIISTNSSALIDESLSIAQHDMCTSVLTTLGSSLGSLVFSRNMFLNIPLSSDWHAVTKKREHLVNYRLMRQNAKRRTYNYAPNQQVLKKYMTLQNWENVQKVPIKLKRYM